MYPQGARVERNEGMLTGHKDCGCCVIGVMHGVGSLSAPKDYS
jgi:hypothetical protein